MTLSLQIKEHKPPRIIIYGAHGLGKSTFGARAPNPVFIQTEDGLDAIDVPAFPLAKTFQDVLNQLKELCVKEHDRKTLVIDSLDWLEPLIWQHLIKEKPVSEKGKPIKDIEDYGWGKGYIHALDMWRQYIQAINYLRNEKKMMIVQIAHAEVKRFENPETDAYDRYQIKVHKRAGDLLMEHADIILFANYYVGIKTEDKGFSERKRALGSGDRFLYTEERPAYLAKNRYGLPHEIPFKKDGMYWKEIAQHVPYLNQLTTGEK